MGSNAKRQTTMAKLNRERRLKERREMKAEKKEARKLAAEMGDVGEMGENVPAEDADGGAPALPD
jgi:CRISPR/Cas system-associated protein Cas10 (large subunit of type III CRISPR-Cas system)